MKILDKYQEELNKATKLITNGEIIAIPTDTYYGLACDPFNFESLKKLFELKEREVTKPLPLLISSKEDLLKFGVDYSKFEKLLNTYWPGPLTVVLKTNHNFFSGMIKDDGYVGFRVPNLDFVKDFKFNEDDVLLFGREDNGLPDNIIDKSDFLISIFMPNLNTGANDQKGVRSLNLSVACGIAIYEAHKQINFQNTN